VNQPLDTLVILSLSGMIQFALMYCAISKGQARLPFIFMTAANGLFTFALALASSILLQDDQVRICRDKDFIKDRYNYLFVGMVAMWFFLALTVLLVLTGWLLTRRGH